MAFATEFTGPFPVRIRTVPRGIPAGSCPLRERRWRPLCDGGSGGMGAAEVPEPTPERTPEPTPNRPPSRPPIDP
ncbi:hypothetical protein Sliba_54830 [Streptomyces nigrescens]|uniref:Uncharacterized protein n=1 Tax=Streptomyces nigrescens TaxID=1920 RepID=A0A640TPH2_STRNI|nr:hypothetical protein Sliba_54830 [Streptomyces libani subsp. libani]GGW04830.1 hypothetical protein GCM10010500_67560 [Streptomyces libani subsp. libani]